MILVLVGYIVYSIVDKLGFVLGMIGGYIVVIGSFYDSVSGVGFFGGIIVGFLVGYVVFWIKKLKVLKVI